MAQQGSPPRRPVRLPASPHDRRPGGTAAGEGTGRDGVPYRGKARGRRRRPDDFDADTDLPPWAGPDIYPRGPGRTDVRPPGPAPGPAEEGDGGPPRESRRSRADVARQRRSRRRISVWGTAAAAVVAVAAIAIWLVGRQQPARTGSYVTTLLPGEFASAPNACRAVSTPTLDGYLPGTRKEIQSLSGANQSQCTFTVDARPLFRVLQVGSQVYQPSLLAPGNGSATANAISSYLQARQALARPPRRTGQPRAAISQLTGLGQAAFGALQVVRDGGDRTDRVTVVVRDRNAVITIMLQGLDRSAHGGYGPVSVTQLRAGAVAAARDALAGLAAAHSAPG